MPEATSASFFLNDTLVSKKNR